MLRLRNETGVRTELVPGLDRHGAGSLAVVIKGTFVLGGDEALELAAEQLPIAARDLWNGAPGRSSLKLEKERTPQKLGTDVVLVGTAYAQGEPVRMLDVELRAGALSHAVRVFGDRHWIFSIPSYRPSEPKPFTRMPLVYERAFGGEDTSADSAADHAWEPRNPVGVGFRAKRSKASLDGAPLPNLELPGELMQSPDDRPAPAGFGFVAPSWAPRLAFAGTYDEAWSRERSPLLPLDFDPRFHQGATPALIAPEPFRGGERVSVTNITPEGDLAFVVPTRRFLVATRIRGETSTVRPALDTLVIEPDDRRVQIVWRATIACGRKLLDIDELELREEG